MFDVSCLVVFYLFALWMELGVLWNAKAVFSCRGQPRPRVVSLFVLITERMFWQEGNLQSTPTQKVRKTFSLGHPLSRGHCKD